MPREEGSSVAHEGMIEVENEEERVALMMVMGRIGRLDERRDSSIIFCKNLFVCSVDVVLIIDNI